MPALCDVLKPEIRRNMTPPGICRILVGLKERHVGFLYKLIGEPTERVCPAKNGQRSQSIRGTCSKKPLPFSTMEFIQREPPVKCGLADVKQITEPADGGPAAVIHQNDSEDEEE